MNSGLLVANPAANTRFIALSRTHISLGPIRAMGGNRRFSVGSIGVHPDSGLCGLIDMRRLGGFGNLSIRGRHNWMSGDPVMGVGCVCRLPVGIHSCRYSLRNVIGGTGCRRCLRRAHRRFLLDTNIDFTKLRRRKMSPMITHVGVTFGAPLEDNSRFISGLCVGGRNVGCIFCRSVFHTSSNGIYLGNVIRAMYIIGKQLDSDRLFSHLFTPCLGPYRSIWSIIR